MDFFSTKRGLGVLFFVIVSSGAVTALTLLNQEQDIRQHAATDSSKVYPTRNPRYPNAAPSPTPTSILPTPSLQPTADINKDGRVDLIDFNIWKKAYIDTSL